MRLLEFLSRLGRKEEEYLVCDKCGRKAKARRFRQKDFTIEFLLGRGRKHEECMRENVALVCRRCGFILCYRCTKGGLPSISCCPKCGEEHMPIFLVELTSEAKKIQKLADKGDALRRAGKYQKAITCYDNALSVNRNDPELYAAKADCLLKLGLPEEALDCYDLALQIDPKADYIWGLKGNTLQDLGTRVRCFSKPVHSTMPACSMRH
jgi:tetratricopeptide (TPR) repeat protein